MVAQGMSGPASPSSTAGRRSAGGHGRTLAASASAPAGDSSPCVSPAFGRSSVGSFRSRAASEVTEDRQAVAPADWDEQLRARRAQKAHQLRARSLEFTNRLNDHGKRRLRMKVCQICHEITRRKKLQKQQDGYRTLREKKFAQGTGSPAWLGDHSEYALGIDELCGEIIDELDNRASPRRVCILDTLTLEELDQLRRDSTFYFIGAFNSSSSEDEDLIDFFTPSPAEMDVPVEEFARKLRQKLAPPVNADWMPTPGETVHKARYQDSRFREPLEFMPCLGRQDAVRNDLESPTLRRVAAATYRRDAADAKLIEDRRITMARKFSQNAFKSKEQQREAQLHKVQMQEMHALRVLDAEDRKMLQDAEAKHQFVVLEEKKRQQRISCELQAERAIAKKRDAATRYVDAWEERCRAANQRVKMLDLGFKKTSKMKQDAYHERLREIGVEKHTEAYSQEEKNDQLRKHIQRWTFQQLEEQQTLESAGLQAEIDAKQSAAAERRSKNMGSRYGLIERAFGPEALGVDIKHHGDSVDRRSDSWLKSAGAWEQERRVFG